MSLLTGHTTLHLVIVGSGAMIFLGNLGIVMGTVGISQHKAPVWPSIAGMLAGICVVLGFYLCDVPRSGGVVGFLGIMQVVFYICYAFGMYKANKKRTDPPIPNKPQSVATPEVWPPPPSTPQV